MLNKNMVQQNTPEWLEMRKEKVGASDAPIIMEVSPWKTPYQLWREKLSLDENKQNFAMMRGHNMESTALKSLEDQTGISFRPYVKIHDHLNWMMASLDAMSLDAKVIAEIKCPGKDDQLSASCGEVPEKYFPQLQHQIEVAGVDWSYYFSFDGSNGVLLKVYRDDKYIKAMISKELQFWECMQDLRAPELTDRDYVNQTDEEFISLASSWRSVNFSIKTLEYREKELREQLILMTNNKNCIGGGVRLSKQVRKGHVDYGKITELNNVNLDMYRKEPVVFWKVVSE